MKSIFLVGYIIILKKNCEQQESRDCVLSYQYPRFQHRVGIWQLFIYLLNKHSFSGYLMPDLAKFWRHSSQEDRQVTYLLKYIVCVKMFVEGMDGWMGKWFLKKVFLRHRSNIPLALDPWAELTQRIVEPGPQVRWLKTGQWPASAWAWKQVLPRQSELQVMAQLELREVSRILKTCSRLLLTLTFLVESEVVLLLKKNIGWILLKKIFRKI